MSVRQLLQNPRGVRMKKETLIPLFCLLTTLWAFPQTSRFAPPEKLRIEVKRKGAPGCTPAKLGDKVSINFIASLANAEKFFSTYDATFRAAMGKPLEFHVGDGKKKVMPALNQGVEGMCEGEERTLYIPPNQGYGYRIFGETRENSGLIYEVKMEKIGGE